ncbi:MAG: hypothetical protein P1U46_02800 [Patescibacteria group bacterium]|nr:hypothetical protein [Patescibacteria group bacterium]
MLVEKIYRYFAEIKLFRFFMSLLSFIYRLIIVKKIDNSFLLNKE